MWLIENAFGVKLVIHCRYRLKKVTSMGMNFANDAARMNQESGRWEIERVGNDGRAYLAPDVTIRFLEKEHKGENHSENVIELQVGSSKLRLCAPQHLGGYYGPEDSNGDHYSVAFERVVGDRIIRFGFDTYGFPGDAAEGQFFVMSEGKSYSISIDRNGSLLAEFKERFSLRDIVDLLRIAV